MPPRIINLGQQAFQPITQQQTPRSVLAQLLLSRGSQLDQNSRGAGIRSAGELIAGALLKKAEFESQQAKNQEQAKSIGELIKNQFPGQVLPPVPGLPDVDERLVRGQGTTSLGTAIPGQPQEAGLDSITESNVPFDELGIGPLFEQAQQQGQGGFGVAPPDPNDFLQLGQKFQGQSPAAIQSATQGVEVPNQLGQLLGGINTSLADRGGIDPTALLGLAQQERARQGETFSVDLGDRIEIRNKLTNDIVRTLPKGATPASKLSAITSQLNRENQQLISQNTIQSREKVAELNREAKAGERVKANILLGNDKKSGRPITQVGFAKRGDPTDIKFVGKPTVQGAGNQVNVSNLPQIPATLLTGITQSDIGLRAIGRIEDIMKRVDISGFVGPVDSRIGDVMEGIGLPNKDQQTIGNITTDLTDMLGRMRSGGVISDQEWENFMKLVPQRTDGFQTFVNKMADFKAKLNDIKGVNLDAAKTFGFNTGTADTNDVRSMTDEQLRALGAK